MLRDVNIGMLEHERERKVAMIDAIKDISPGYEMTKEMAIDKIKDDIKDLEEEISYMLRADKDEVIKFFRLNN